VYSARPADVRTVIVDGETVVHDFRLARADRAAVMAEAAAEARNLAARAL
jgi:ApbE superfamily uncharacterized protein (UPF0280 family)